MSRHALRSSKRNHEESIRIEWPLLPGSETGQCCYRKIKESHIRFGGKDGDDIAVIECDPPLTEAGAYPDEMTTRLFSAGEIWCSYGFPRAGRLNGGDGTYDVHGSINTPNPDKSEVALDIKIELSKADNWKGISGAPVFIGSSMIGILVVKKVGEQFRLYGVSTVFLLRNNDEFRVALGLSEQAPSFGFAMDVLKARKEVFARLRRQVDCQPDSPEALLKHCAAVPVSKLLKYVRDAQRKALLEQKTSECRSLSDFLVGMLPHLADQVCAERIKNSIGANEDYIVSVNYSTIVSAEMLVANANDRVMDFKVFKPDQVLPSYSMPLPPEMGSSTAKDQLKETTDDIYRKIGGDDISAGLIEGATHYLYDEEIPDGYFSGQADESLKLDLVKDYLEGRAEDGEPNYYWLIYLPEKEEDQSHVMRIARLIRDTYPQLLFIILSQDNGQRRKEVKEYRLLNETLAPLYNLSPEPQ